MQRRWTTAESRLLMFIVSVHSIPLARFVGGTDSNDSETKAGGDSHAMSDARFEVD